MDRINGVPEEEKAKAYDQAKDAEQLTVSPYIVGQIFVAIAQWWSSEMLIEF